MGDLRSPHPPKKNLSSNSTTNFAPSDLLQRNQMSLRKKSAKMEPSPFHVLINKCLLPLSQFYLATFAIFRKLPKGNNCPIWSPRSFEAIAIANPVECERNKIVSHACLGFIRHVSKYCFYWVSIIRKPLAWSEKSSIHLNWIVFFWQLQLSLGSPKAFRGQFFVSILGLGFEACLGTTKHRFCVVWQNLWNRYLSICVL
jgi:hypothetical protein